MITSARVQGQLKKRFIFTKKSSVLLEYKLTDTVINPQLKKIKAMEQVVPPKRSKNLEWFLGVIEIN